MELAVKEVEFNGGRLLAVMNPENGKVYTGVNMMCEALGLDRDKQKSKIQNHMALSKGATTWGVPSKGGIQDTLVLEVDYVPLWLCSINPKLVRKESQEKLITYQLKAKDVLAGVFIKGETIGVDPAKLEALQKRNKELEEDNQRLLNSIEWNAAKAVSEEEDRMPMFRSAVHKLIKDYAKAFNVEPSKPYGRLYKRFKKETGIDVFKLAECKGYECIMDAIEEIQMIDALYDVADDEFCCVKDGKEYWKQ